MTAGYLLHFSVPDFSSESGYLRRLFVSYFTNEFKINDRLLVINILVADAGITLIA